MADCAALEMLCPGNRTGGSNPPLSARPNASEPSQDGSEAFAFVSPRNGRNRPLETEYANTDFDLKSATPFDTLNRELAASCCVLHYYSLGDDGTWSSIVESAHDEETASRNAEIDILAIIEALDGISPAAKAELDACSTREFNIGFHCWDTWSYAHNIPAAVVQAVATAGCSLAVTLYPMRKPDGTPRQ